MAKFESKYAIGQMLALEYDPDAIGTVLAVTFVLNTVGPQYTLRMRGGGLAYCAESELIRV